MFGDDDLDAIYDAEMAVDATFNGATAVRVFFDRAYQEALGIAGTQPVARGRVTEFASAAACVGKTLLIAGTTYTIRGYEPIDDGAEVQLTLKV